MMAHAVEEHRERGKEAGRQGEGRVTTGRVAERQGKEAGSQDEKRASTHQQDPIAVLRLDQAVSPSCAARAPRGPRTGNNAFVARREALHRRQEQALHAHGT